jgi:hypothetical protein
MSAAGLAGPGDDAHSERPVDVVEVIGCFISRDFGASAAKAAAAR